MRNIPWRAFEVVVRKTDPSTKSTIYAPMREQWFTLTAEDGAELEVSIPLGGTGLVFGFRHRYYYADIQLLAAHIFRALTDEETSEETESAICDRQTAIKSAIDELLAAADQIADCWDKGDLASEQPTRRLTAACQALRALGAPESGKPQGDES